MVKFITITLVVGLLAFSYVQSSSLGGAETGSSATNGQGSTSAPVHPNTTESGKSQASKPVASSGRYLGNVGGYEQSSYGAQTGYEQQLPSYAPPSYSAPIVQSYQAAPVAQSYQAAPVAQSYQAAPVAQSYQAAPVAQSYSAPVQSYSAPVQSYSAPLQSSYEQPITQTYQQPLVSNYSTQSYSAPVQSYSAPVQSYSAPVQSYSAPVQSYSAPVQSYSAPVQSYSAPVQSYSNYSAPVQSYSAPVQSYSAPAQSYSAPTQSYSNYSTPSYQTQSYSAPVQSYSAPVQSYSAPVQSYSAPVQSYSAPVQSYSAPTQSYSNYSTQSYVPQVSTYSAPQQTYSAPLPTYEAPIVQSSQSYGQVETYAAPSYGATQSYGAAPQTQSYGASQSYGAAPQTQSYGAAPSYGALPTSYAAAPVASSYGAAVPLPSYSAPVQSYSAPVQSYSAPVQSYSAPVQSYSAPVQSYSAPVQSYSAPTQSYSAPILPSYGATQSYPQQQGTVYKRSLDEITGAPDSTATAAASSGTVAADDMTASDSSISQTYLPQQATRVAPTAVASYQPTQILQSYLDTQPEFTQSWADFSQAPGYLPLIFRNFLTPYQQQQQYKGAGGYKSAVGPQNIGFGYITTVGPVNPASFYVPVTLPYYYRIPPISPFYSPAPALTYQPQIRPTVYQAAQTYKAGYGKRSLSGHEAAPYQLLVDHLSAAASENKEIFTNVSSIECPAKPSDYTCPQMLKFSKEELKKKICDYETVLSGMITLVPDTEKAQTRCGAMKIDRQNVKNDDDITELPDKMAIVMGKDCQYDSSKVANNDQVFMFVKTAIPSGTKFILADGTNIDLLSSQEITNEEIANLMKQCPKKSQ